MRTPDSNIMYRRPEPPVGFPRVTRLFILAGLLLAACSGVENTLTQEAPSTEMDSPVAADTPMNEAPTPTPAPEDDFTATTDAAIAACLASDHEVGHSIAETFNITYEQVMEWFCYGIPFDDILLALQTSEEVDIPIEDLFDMRDEGKSWDTIWQEIGLTD